MTIQSGSRIGSYEILAPLGAGGMGEVWKAHDSRINRDVAIKVLPEEVTSNPDRLARFEQEAQAAGALNHPNILTVFEMGTHEGHPYLVTELLEGRSLREKLGDTHRASSSGDHLSVRKALELGAQIATGLAAAHEKGIVHRDLKPENIFVTSDGRVKILDFGLAKLTAAPGEENLTNAQTAQRQTSPGTVMGTAGYMAPEQVRGQNADQRADIFACGVVLYEMLSGRRAFDGASSADTMSAILKEDPPELSGEHLRVPVAVERIVRRCLEKEPAQRFQSARDLAFALEAVEGSSTSSGQAAAIATGNAMPNIVARVGLALALLVVAVAAYYAGTRKAAPATDAAAAPLTDPVKFTPLTFRPLIIFEAAFAPDQRTVVFSAAEEGTYPSIYTVSPEYPEPRDAGLPGVHLLSISTKGEMAVLTHPQFAFHRQFEGTLARLPVGGTAPREILEGVRQAVWSPDGSELAIIRTVDGADRLEYPIGKVLHTTNGYFSDLKISPDNSHIAFFEHPQRGDDRGPIRVVELATGKITTLADGFWGCEGIAWARDGKSVLFSADRSGAVYNLRAVDLAGNERLVRADTEGLVIHEINEAGTILISKYQIGFEVWGRLKGMDRERNLSWLDFSTNPIVSRDGTMLVIDEESAYAGLTYATCLRKTPDSPVVRLGDGLPVDLSSDGKWVLSQIYGTPQRLVAYPTGPGEAREVDPNGLGNYTDAAWFPDGKNVLICGWKNEDAARCFVKPVEGGELEPVSPEGMYTGAIVSPDGSRLAIRDTEGRGYVIDLEGGEPVDMKGLTPQHDLIRWTTDGRSILVSDRTRVPIRVERLDLESGRQETILTIEPSNHSSLLSANQVSLADDNAHYAYQVWRTRTQLFTVEGLR
jgi:Tol biopolymer transport system component